MKTWNKNVEADDIIWDAFSGTETSKILYFNITTRQTDMKSSLGGILEGRGLAESPQKQQIVSEAAILQS